MVVNPDLASFSKRISIADILIQFWADSKNLCPIRLPFFNPMLRL